VPDGDRIARLNAITRLGLAARVVAGAALVGLYAWEAAQGRGATASGAAGVGVWIIWTIVLLGVLRSTLQLGTTSLLFSTALVDGFALVLIAIGLDRIGGVLFGWYLAEAVMLAVILRRRLSWIPTAVLAASFAIARLASRGATGPAEALLLLLELVVLVLVGLGVSIAVVRQEDRRSEMEAEQDTALELNARLARSVAELEALVSIIEIVHSTLDVDQIGAELLRVVDGVIEVPGASIHVIDTAEGKSVFSAGGPPPSWPGDEPAVAAQACTEVLSHARHVVIFCGQADAIATLTAEERVILQAVASELVVAVENSRLYALTKRLSITDELTGLFNYRYLQQRLEEEVSRAGRYGKNLSLLMIDIDDFKHVNDRHGHLVGDAVLAEIGQVLKAAVREVDVVARYGGEEFSVVLPETAAEGALVTAEKVRTAIAGREFTGAAAGRDIRVTVSVGAASYPAHAHDKGALLQAADQALYHAKQTGKNRVSAPPAGESVTDAGLRAEDEGAEL
jgi:diguanylate cyclase (GGDEF)-like protein